MTDIITEIIAKDGSYFAFILGMTLVSLTYMAYEEAKKYGIRKIISELYEDIVSYMASLRNPWRIAI